MTIDQLAAFFGWMTVLNIGLLLLAWLFIWPGSGPMNCAAPVWRKIGK